MIVESHKHVLHDYWFYQNSTLERELPFRQPSHLIAKIATPNDKSIRVWFCVLQYSHVTRFGFANPYSNTNGVRLISLRFGFPTPVLFGLCSQPAAGGLSSRWKFSFRQLRSRPREPERPVFCFLFSAITTQFAPVAGLWISFRARSSRSARAESSGTVCARGVALFCLESGTIAASSLLKQCSRAVLFFIALSSLILFVLWLDCCRNLFRSSFWATRLKRSMFSSFNYFQTVVFWTRPQWVRRNAYENMNWVLVWFFVYSLAGVLTSIDSCFCCGS
jgi:hypothetical protein